MEAPTLGAAVASGSMGGAGTGCASRTMARAEPGLRLMWLATTTTSGPFCVGNRSSTDDGAVPSGSQRELVMAVLGESSTAACSSVELPIRTATTDVGRRGLPQRISASLCANSDPGTSSWPRAPHDTGSITAARAIPNQRVSVDFVDRLVLSMRAREQCARQGLLGAGQGSSRKSPRQISRGMSRSWPRATPLRLATTDVGWREWLLVQDRGDRRREARLDPAASRGQRRCFHGLLFSASNC